jgi:PilZ domain
MTQKRRQYRVKKVSADDLIASLARAGASPVPAQIVDISSGGISVFVKRVCDPGLPDREAVHLRLSSPHMKVPLSAPAIVRRSEESAEGRVYGLEFLDWLGLLSRIPPALARLFNKRGDSRVEPDSGDRIDVAVESKSLPFQIGGKLRDLSSTGLSFSAADDVEKFLSKIDRVKVSFSLPGRVEVIAFWGDILHRNTSDGSIHYGICFDQKLTRQFKKKQDQISAFLEEQRQKAILDHAR